MNYFKELSGFSGIKEMLDGKVKDGKISCEDAENIENQISDTIQKSVPSIVKEYFKTIDDDPEKSLVVDSRNCYSIIPKMYINLKSSSTLIKILRFTANYEWMQNGFPCYGGKVLCKRVSTVDNDPTPYISWSYMVTETEGFHVFNGKYCKTLEGALEEFEK